MIHKLSPQTLQDSKYVNKVDYYILNSGTKYYTEGHVKILDVDEASAVLQVSGNSNMPYNVIVYIDQNAAKNPIRMSCDCPYSKGSEQSLCKHMVAAALALVNYFEKSTISDWTASLNKVLEIQSKPTVRKTEYVLVFSLQEHHNKYRFFPYYIDAHLFSPEEIENQELLISAINERGLSKKALRADRIAKQNNIVGSPIRHMAFADLVNSDDLYYFRYDYPFNMHLSLISDACIFLGNSLDPLIKSLKVEFDQAEMKLSIEEVENGLSLKLLASSKKYEYALFNESYKMLSLKPMWILANSVILPVQETAASISQVLEEPQIFVPNEERETFYSHYLGILAERFPIMGDFTGNWTEISQKPKPRLYLKEESGELVSRIRYNYGEIELEYDRTYPEKTVKVSNEDEVKLIRVHRHPELEKEYWSGLSEFGLKRGVDGAYLLRSKLTPVDFLFRYIPKLVQAGYEVFGHEDLKSAKINRSKPTISLGVSSGIDWFDLEAVAKFGDITVSLSEIRKTIKKREQYIKLADGTMGKIPKEWIEKYKHIFELGVETENGLRFKKTQVALIEEALNEADFMDSDEEYRSRCDKMTNFENISPKELPESFVGEMRNYQKSGYDWLHFLHDYEFGGCLADDMGIGKTIQTLVFLQSLRELKHSGAADLVVMPKSILTNWEREAARFTPNLKVFIHSGLDRPTSSEIFDKYDLILTTYGIMRRDIKLLREYRFHYLVLDESQAIKNPLADTSKAAKLLKTDHRLVLTGTPVENSTVELWSQFDFLNPGQLGTMEYFRSELAGPIERDQDPAAAEYLRSIVYPFILRRTKDQVAKELPSRTERVVYCDMSADQKKVYTEYRNSFRDQLLGKIEEEGINNVRMKILEGLLRLRQISNHPKLVNPAYTGDSAKFDVLLSTLETLQAEGHKVLVFSQFTKMLRIVRESLRKHKIKFLYLDGQTENRQEIVDEFQTDESIPFFLISLKAGGVGLNLTAADYVIHIDPWWNPAVERQATDRTHRIGQDKPVFVYKLIARDTVEEKILKLQEKKKALVDQLISTETSFFKSLTKDDINALFS